jgi:hypothetical protein
MDLMENLKLQAEVGEDLLQDLQHRYLICHRRSNLMFR